VSRVAFVTPWFGEAIPGGSETLARTVAYRLHEAGMDVEILTTCIRDLYDDWGRNHHAPGTEYYRGIPVQRFPVKRRRAKAFNRLNRRLGQGERITPREERTFIHQMFVAPSLYRYIKRHQRDYLFIFTPFMFASTYHGVLTAPDRSLIIPCLHDDGVYARLGIYHDLLRSARGLLYNTATEASFGDSLIGPVDGQIRRVIGVGIDTDLIGDGARFRAKHQIEGPILLYAGRLDEGKNVPLLIEYWSRYVDESSRQATLVLIGSASPPTDGTDRASIRDLGFLSPEDKIDAFAAADICCQPSLNESFSLVIMESWVQGTPVLVHGDCAVTSEHCATSGGGLRFTTYDEFARSVDRVLDDPPAARAMGQLGREYVLDHYQWPTIVARYQEVITEACSIP
jgi:glycosyltransferase involved in cell wall biosynthesis